MGEMLDGITSSVDMNLSKLWETLEDREPGVLQPMGSQSRHDLAAEEQQKQVCGCCFNFLGDKQHCCLDHLCILLSEVPGQIFSPCFPWAAGLSVTGLSASSEPSSSTPAWPGLSRTVTCLSVFSGVSLKGQNFSVWVKSKVSSFFVFFFFSDF